MMKEKALAAVVEWCKVLLFVAQELFTNWAAGQTCTKLFISANEPYKKFPFLDLLVPMEIIQLFVMQSSYSYLWLLQNFIYMIVFKVCACMSLSSIYFNLVLE